MKIERSHRTTSTGELFIFFASRLSSSSMKISSKSILSQGSAREPSQISLTSSLSRRLKSSGSIRGGQASPMFSTSGKKRGTFENPEPSSPKVTCIGQVRVKTKKQGKKMRTGSQRRVEASFRKTEQSLQAMAGQEHHQGQGFQFQNPRHECLPHKNQKWVHLPLTICEALRAFGAEFNCFLPCRSSCMTSEKEKEDICVRSENGRSCGSVFARWLVALQDGDGKGREIELLVGEKERLEKTCSHRRQMFEGIEFKENDKEEEARKSMCIPPKNALLLMRCRSDPVKTAALANRFWEAPPNDDDEDGQPLQREEGEDREVKVEVADTGLSRSEEIFEKCEFFSGKEHERSQELSNLIMQEEMAEEKLNQVIKNPERCIGIDGLMEESKEDPEKVGELEKEFKEEEGQEFDVNPVAALPKEADFSDNFAKFIVGNSENIEDEVHDSQLIHENEHVKKEPPLQNDSEVEELENRASSDSSSSAFVHSVQEESVKNKHVGGHEKQEGYEKIQAEVRITEGLLEELEETQESESTQKRSEPENTNTQEVEVDTKSKVEKERPVLPDCLLLMMCEPKLSMEVSKETWVCNRDFFRWLPDRDRNRKVNKVEGCSGEAKKQLNFRKIKAMHSEQRKIQPPRSSCSLPAAATMASLIEQKLVGSISNAYEPFVLTRCKSEPRRSAAAKLAPDTCFRNNQNLELHRPATASVGGHELGFKF